MYQRRRKTWDQIFASGAVGDVDLSTAMLRRWAKMTAPVCPTSMICRDSCQEPVLSDGQNLNVEVNTTMPSRVMRRSTGTDCHDGRQGWGKGIIHLSYIKRIHAAEMFLARLWSM